MNWKNIRFVLLCLLLLLNVSLLIFNRYQEIRNYTVPQERIDGIRGLFEENGISINVSLNRKHDPKPWLKISLADEDTLSGIITSYFVDGFQKVYYVDNMMAQFTKDSEVFVMDYQNSSIAYTNQSNSEEDETVQSLSASDAIRFTEEFAERLIKGDMEMILDSAVQQEDGRYKVTLSQRYKNTQLFFNQLEAVVGVKGIHTAKLTCYNVEGYTKEKYYTYPVDEVLYSCLTQITAEGDSIPGLSVDDIRYGYDFSGKIDSNLRSSLFMKVFLSDGRMYKINLMYNTIQ